MKGNLKITFLLILFIISNALTGIAQEDNKKNNWMVGITAMPLHYWKYNKVEYNQGVADKNKMLSSVFPVSPFSNVTLWYNDYYPTKQKIFNPTGISLGINAEKYWAKHWGVKIELSYAYQLYRFNFKYQQKSLSNPSPDTIFSISDMNKNNIFEDPVIDVGGGKATFHYLRLPISINYRKLISQSKSVYFIFSQGIEINYLLTYNINSNYEGPPFVFNQNSVYTPKHLINSWVENGNSKTNEYATGWLYNRLVLSSVSYTGIKGLLKHKYTGRHNIYVNAGLRFEYDITRMDNENTRFNNDFTGGYLLNIGTHANPASVRTRNIRLGVEFCIQYYLVKNKRY